MGGKRPGINCCIFYFSYVDINNLFLRSIHMRNLHIVIHQMAIKRRAASKPARKTSTLPFHTYIVSYGLSRPIVQPNQASDSDRRDEVPLNQLLIFPTQILVLKLRSIHTDTRDPERSCTAIRQWKIPSGEFRRFEKGHPNKSQQFKLWFQCTIGVIKIKN